MARYIREVQLDRPDDFVQYIMTDFLGKHGFRLGEFKGEQVYRAGGGLIEIPKFLSWGYQNGVFHVEAWTRNCWLPGVYGRENAMTGWMGCVPKNAYKKDIEELISLLIREGHRNIAGVFVSDNYQSIEKFQGMQGAGQPVYVRGTDTSRYATMALIFALIGLIAGLIVPLIGVIFGALGITYGNKAKNSPKKGIATAALVIGIIAVVISVVSWGINIFVTMRTIMW